MRERLPTIELSPDISAMKFCTRILLVLSLALISAGLWWRFIGGQYFGLQRIVVVVDDVQRYETGQLGQAFYLRDANLFTVDLNKVKTLFEDKPWVYKATVKRHFPNALRVEVQSNRVVAYWYEGESRRLVNQQGQLFNPPWSKLDEMRAGPLPILGGAAELSEQTWDLYQRIAPQLQKVGLEMTQLSVSQQGSWKAFLKGGMVVYLGKGELLQVEQRLQEFVLTIPKVMKSYAGRVSSSVAVADLRYRKGYALRLRTSARRQQM